MRKYLMLCTLILVVILSGCKDNDVMYNYRPRQNDTYISNDGKVLVEYKTDENGALERIYVDRLLTIEEMITKNPFIDYDITIEGFTDDIFTEVPSTCFLPSGVKVPVNIEVGSVRYKFKSTECLYKEVGRDNEFKTTSFAREYGVKDTIEEPLDTKINIVVFIEGSTQLFTEVYALHHTFRGLGVYGIEFSVDNGSPLLKSVDFTKHMKIYEQYLLMQQDNEKAVDEIYGISSSINILSLEDLENVSSVIENFTDLYEAEFDAINELEIEIGINPVEETTEEEVPEEETEETTYRMWNYEY